MFESQNPGVDQIPSEAAHQIDAHWLRSTPDNDRTCDQSRTDGRWVLGCRDRWVEADRMTEEEVRHSSECLENCGGSSKANYEPSGSGVGGCGQKFVSAMLAWMSSV